MSATPSNHSRLFVLVWLLAALLGNVYNLEQGNQETAEKSVIEFHTLFEKAESSMTALKQDLDEIKQSVAQKLAQCQRHNVSASFLSFREELIALLDKFHLEVINKGEPTAEPTKESTVQRDCADVYNQQSKVSGVFTIQPLGSEPFQVYCDMTTDGGGWTVFQKRGDFPGIKVDNFNKSWEEYKNGFGDLKTEFWLGLSKISLMTKPDNGHQELRVDLADWDSHTAYANYQNFTVEDENQGFRLRVGSYSGNAGDSLYASATHQFSTSDRNNDTPSRNCALEMSGGWWFNNCGNACLNCLNLKSRTTGHHNGIFWYTWRGIFYSLSKAEMKFRPMGWTSNKLTRENRENQEGQ